MGLDNPIHIAFLLILLLLVFGAKRLPEMGKSLGSGMRGFKDALSGEGSDSAAAGAQQPLLAVQPAPVAPAAPAMPAALTAPAALARDAGPAPQPVAE